MIEDQRPSPREELSEDEEEEFKTPEAPHFAWGAKAIGAIINRTEQQVFYLHRIRAIPTFNVGEQIVGVIARLRDPSQWPKAK